MTIGIGIPDQVRNVDPKVVAPWAARAERAGFSTLGTIGRITAMADGVPVTSEGLGERTELAERHVREWLLTMAASGYITYVGGSSGPRSRRFARYRLTPEQVEGAYVPVEKWTLHQTYPDPGGQHPRRTVVVVDLPHRPVRRYRDRAGRAVHRHPDGQPGRHLAMMPRSRHTVD